MKNSNNKETINLLDLLSESDSDISDLDFTPRKKKVKRKHRLSARAKMKQTDSCGCSKSDMRIISLWFAAVLITFWLIALSWLAVILYGEIKRMDISIKSVIAGSEGVPDALQKCHSLSRDLQNNQSIIFTHLSDLKLQINNFTTQLALIQRSLHRAKDWFNEDPALFKVQGDLKDLSNNVGSFGSQIQDLSNTVKKLEDSNIRIQDVQKTIQQNVTSIKNTVTELSNITQKPQILITNETKIKTEQLNATIVHLSDKLMDINETLSRAVQWVAEDQKKDHDKLVLLQETTQNVSMKVISLERECVKTTILQSVKELDTQVKEIHIVNDEISKKMKQLEQSYDSLKNSTSLILAAIPDMQTQRLIKTKILEETIGDVATTEQDRSVLVSNEAPSKRLRSDP
ncbi:uncharacterized protein isoform X2 [Bombus fervidus]|uniref:uncharacterized protein isoform X2 n=1 Tax=Bombus fervidus TaxID=203811 RepID=UPI003AB62C38